MYIKLSGVVLAVLDLYRDKSISEHSQCCSGECGYGTLISGSVFEIKKEMEDCKNETITVS